jgi:hypothetical protein
VRPSELSQTIPPKEILSEVFGLLKGVCNETPNFVVFSGSKEQRYGVIIDKNQSHNTPRLILKINTFYVSIIGAPHL